MNDVRSNIEQQQHFYEHAEDAAELSFVSLVLVGLIYCVALLA